MSENHVTADPSTWDPAFGAVTAAPNVAPPSAETDIIKSSVPSETAVLRANARVSNAGWPDPRTKTIFEILLIWPASKSGGSRTRVTGRGRKRGLLVRYKISAHIKPLIQSPLRRQVLKVSFTVRYKISACTKLLSLWDLSPS